MQVGLWVACVCVWSLHVGLCRIYQCSEMYACSLIMWDTGIEVHICPRCTQRSYSSITELQSLWELTETTGHQDVFDFKRANQDETVLKVCKYDTSKHIIAGLSSDTFHLWLKFHLVLKQNSFMAAKKSNELQMVHLWCFLSILELDSISYENKNTKVCGW